MTATPTSIKHFRYDINALRAIAVIGVLLFHYNVKYFKGGFAGVDVFFVISGYLMSKIIISAINKSSFSFQEFYGRRLKRIVPALFFLVLVLTITCFFFYFPNAYQFNERNVVASLLFVSNIVYWKTGNYFNAASDDNILLHTWSLSAEWQFYLIYPVLLLGFSKLVKKRIPYLLWFTGFTLLLYIGAIVYNKIDKTGSFYLLPSRSWEMLAGGIAFLAEDLLKAFRYKKFVAIAGYILIFGCLVILKSSLRWPGVYTLAPVLATLMVIVANYNDFKILKFKGVQFIGRISYSLYLWHWPVFVIAQFIGIEMTLISTVLMILIAIILAYLSYRFIESNNYMSSNTILITTGSLAVVALCLSHFDANKFLFKKSTIDIAAYRERSAKKEKKQFEGAGCFLSTKGDSFNNNFCLKIDGTKRNVLLLGDSHAAQFSQSFREYLNARNINLLQATASGCFPILQTSGESRCTGLINYIFKDFIVNNAAKIDGIIICADWANRDNDAKLIKDIKGTMVFLNQYHIKTILIGQNETYNLTYPYIAARENEYNSNESYKYLNADANKLNLLLLNKLKPYYIDIYNHGAVPKVQNNEVPYMVDKNHYTKYGADIATAKLMKNAIAINFFSGMH